MPSLEWNLKTWNEEHDWARDGDEWSRMAQFCGVPYDVWKRQLIEHFLLPYARDADVLEIAPGHGRWSETLVKVARKTTLVDMSPSCIAACKERLSEFSNVAFHVNDGTSLSFVPDGSIDFVWSFDSFVHIDAPVIDGYFAECARVLRPGGHLVVHHADKRRWTLGFVPLTKQLGMPGRVAQRVLSQGRLRGGGNRSDLSRSHIAAMLSRHGFQIREQTNAWGDERTCTVAKYHDAITVAQVTSPRR
jgi:ubiquinone/menaquinone biosynthesis C-methylase UbiE